MMVTIEGKIKMFKKIGTIFYTLLSEEYGIGMQDCDIKYKEAYVSERILWQYVIEGDSNVDRDDLDNSTEFFCYHNSVFNLLLFLLCKLYFKYVVTYIQL